jgi:hypothetical protein
MKTLSQNSRSPGRYLNPGPPEYEAGVLPTRLRRSVVLLVLKKAGVQAETTR